MMRPDNVCAAGVKINGREPCPKCGSGPSGPCWEDYRNTVKARDELLKALSAASGYLLNAKIDLETGAPKRTAIATIEGGLKVVRAALDEHSPKETR